MIMQITAHNVEIQGRKVILDTHATPYYLNQLTALKGKLKVTIKEYKESKSQRQNNYVWALFTKISLEQNGSKRQEDVERVYHYVLQKANVEHERLIAPKDSRAILESVFSVVIQRGNDLLRNGITYREFDCYVGISKFDTAQMSLLIDTTIDYGVELGIPYAELDNMKGAYDL